MADAIEKMNKLLEENAWLQTELEEQKNRSNESVQRLKDELRGLILSFFSILVFNIFLI